MTSRNGVVVKSCRSVPPQQSHNGVTVASQRYDSGGAAVTHCQTPARQNGTAGPNYPSPPRGQGATVPLTRLDAPGSECMHRCGAQGTPARTGLASTALIFPRFFFFRGPQNQTGKFESGRQQFSILSTGTGVDESCMGRSWLECGHKDDARPPVPDRALMSSRVAPSFPTSFAWSRDCIPKECCVTKLTAAGLASHTF